MLAAISADHMFMHNMICFVFIDFVANLASKQCPNNPTGCGIVWTLFVAQDYYLKKKLPLYLVTQGRPATVSTGDFFSDVWRIIIRGDNDSLLKNESYSQNYQLHTSMYGHSSSDYRIGIVVSSPGSPNVCNIEKLHIVVHCRQYSKAFVHVSYRVSYRDVTKRTCQSQSQSFIVALFGINKVQKQLT